MKKSVLHELLAVEGDLDGAHKKILQETSKGLIVMPTISPHF